MLGEKIVPQQTRKRDQMQKILFPWQDLSFTPLPDLQAGSYGGVWFLPLKGLFQFGIRIDHFSRWARVD